MKNTDIFTSSGYDMVVAVTQKSINDQLSLLQNPDIGILPTTLIMELQWSEDGLTETAKIFQSWDSVEKLNGLPLNQAINAEYTSSVQITESGTVVNLVLTFTKGLFYWMNMGNGHIMPGMDMTGWTWGIAVNVDLAGMERDDIANHRALSPSVQKTLENFTSDQFSVSSLYLDLQSTDLAQYNPAVTSTLNAPPAIHNSFLNFVTSYLGDIKKDPTTNPYVLGFTVVGTTQTPNLDDGVPDSLNPTGSTFTVFHDPISPERSTINFVLDTKASSGHNGYGNHPTPGNFDSNWISPTDQVDGKMTYGSMNFLETVVINPFYLNYAQKVSSQIGQLVNIGSDKSYDQAKQLGAVGRAADATGFIFKIHDVPDGNDQYTNTLTVNWGASKTGNGVTINLSGTIHAYKYNSVNWGIEHAQASATMDYSWASEIDISLAVDAKGIPQLTMNNPTIQITDSHSSSWKNDFAKFVDILGKMIGGFADLFTAFQDGGKATEWFLGWMLPDVHGIGGLDLTLGSVSSPAQRSVILPAGDIFFFKDVGILPEGCLSLGLTYKSATGNSVSAIATESATKPIMADPAMGVVTKANSGNMNTPKSHLSLTEKKSNELPPTSDPSHNTAQSTTLGNPLVDKFSVQQIAPPPTTPPTMLDITVSCELMSNSKVGMPVSPSENMVVVQDNKGSPLIFTIGSDGRFYLLKGDSGQTDSGWSTVNLLVGFSGYTTATAFDVVQDTKGAISVAFAITNSATSSIDTFFASLLSNDLTITDFTKLSAVAKMVPGVPATFTAETIRLGSSDDTKQPLLTIEGSSNSKHVLYQLDVGATAAEMLELPEDITPGANNLLGHCQGFSFGQRANFFLYKVGDSKRLISRSNADAIRGSVSFDYSSPALPTSFQKLDYNCIQTATSRSGAVNTASDLYIGTATGVCRIPNGKAAAVEQVVPLKDVHGITAAIDGDHVSLWITSSPNLLYYVYGQRGSGTVITWNSPVLFASNVLSVAPMRNISKSSNELFVLDSDLTVNHYWQDPVSTFWRSHISAVPKSNYVVNFNSFTTHVHFEANSLAISNQKILVTCSEWQYCTINGLLYSLDADVPAEIMTDAMGNITVISNAVDISPPVLHLQSPAFAETINIYPNGKILANLQNITDGTSLQNARAQDGSKVLPDTTTTENANGIAANISNIHTAATQNYPPTSSGQTFTAVQHPASPPASGLKQTLHQRLNVSHLPNGFIAGIASANGAWQPHTLETATKHLALFSVESAVGDFFGDVWHDIEQLVDGGAIINAIKDTGVYLSDGLSFIIQKADDVLQFVLTLTDRVVRIALDTLLAAFKALNFLFKLIGIDLSAILRWLGHLIGWDKIWDTHKLIASTMTNYVKFGMDNLSDGIGSLKQLINEAFAKVEGEIDSFILPDSAKAQSITNSTEVQGASDPQMQSPQANFASYHLNNAVAAPSSGTPTSSSLPPLPNALNNDQDPLTQFLNDVLIPFGETVLNRLGTDAGDLLHLIKSGSLDDLRVLVVDLIKTILDPIKTAVEGLLTFVQSLIGDVEELLDGDLDIPIIGAIYEFVTALFGDEEKFSIINGMSFLMAIPIVIMMEIAGAGLPGDHNGMHFETPEWLSSLKGFVSSVANGSTPLPTKKLVASHPNFFRNLATSEPSDAEFKTFSAVAGMFASCGAFIMNPLDVAPGDLPEAVAAKFYLTIWNGCFSFPLPVPPVEWTYGYRVAMWGILTLTGVICNFPRFKSRWMNAAGNDADEAARYKSLFKLGTRSVGALLCAFIVDFYEHKDGLTVATDVVGNFGALVTGFGGTLSDKKQQLIVKGTGITIAEAGALMSFANSLKKLNAAEGFIAVGPGGQ